LQKALIEICDAHEGSLVDSIDLPAQGKKGREQITLLRTAFQSSIVEPFEVIEMRRGFDFKIQGKISGKTYLIAQPEEAHYLEPMEWIIGRVLLFQNRAYLLNEWSKLPFKKRKWLKSLIQERWQESDPSFSLPAFNADLDLEADTVQLHDRLAHTWLKEQSGWFFEKLEEVT
jgi:hypothetical protein